LTTHAFFKALLFLSAGSVIIGMHHEQDIWHMGGLKKKMPVTFWTFLAGALALSGIPPFAGFYSKDSILAQCLEQKNYLLFAVAVFVAGLTAFYTFRLFFVVFFGKEKTDHAKHAHESPLIITTPLVILAIFATIGGFIGITNNYGYQFSPTEKVFPPIFSNTENGYLGNTAPVFVHQYESHSIMQQLTEPLKTPVPMLIGIGVALAGIFLAFSLYKNGDKDPLPAKLGGLATAMKNKFYFDELYEATFIRAHDFLAAVADWIDRWILEGAIIGAIRGGTDLSGRALRLVQTGNLQTYAFLFVLGVALLLYFVLGK
jgi:NADH-quinone oxidoreductase subunit L